MHRLLEVSGAKFNIETRTVQEHGIVLLRDINGNITNEALRLFDSLNISKEQSNEDRLGDFTARITYLSFPTREYSPQNYKNKLLSMGHSSPWSLKTISILVVGLSIETVLEFVSGYANRSGRLTSSDTKAMNNPYYYTGNNARLESLIGDFVRWRNSLDTTDLTLNESNQFQLASKCSAIVVSMEPQEWEELLDSRLDPDTHCEIEYENILKRIRSTVPVSLESVLRASDANMKRFIEYAQDNGMFYKKSTNSYWYPSLNAGIPKTVKPDWVHQGTYRLHDLFHTILPDPLPHTNRFNYVITKFMGELFSNLIADGWAISILDQKCGVNYDYTQRHVYPLWKTHEELGYNPIEILKEISTIVAKHFLYLEKAPENYENYIKHYSYFYDTDIVWNARNYDKHLASRRETLRKTAEDNLNLWKNEHMYVTSSSALDLEDIINIFITHIEGILSGSLMPRGNGVKLGNLLSDRDDLRIFPHEKMKYGDISRKEYEECLITLGTII
ncbi:hypothetical protein ABGV42_01635 [Paenibacillus pabuli]|uniref:hypothetical protein n=1 Tax=Paenibacillus pabuli TaxID=1472 RepID=UPI0032430068